MEESGAEVFPIAKMLTHFNGNIIARKSCECIQKQEKLYEFKYERVLEKSLTEALKKHLKVH